MRRIRAILPFGAAVAAGLAAYLILVPAQAASPDHMSLLETLSEWKYPGSKMLGRATMSDGGNPLLQSVKCRAVLTTSDPIEKVIKFYTDKFEPVPDQGAPAKGKDANAKSVSSQDDSRDRPVTLRIIVVNKDDTATTLVISRADGEKETHIAWLHYLRLSGKR